MKSTSQCKFCDWTHTGHGNSHQSAQWEHLRQQHPEQHKQKVSLVNEIKRLKQQGRETFGPAWHSGF